MKYIYKIKYLRSRLVKISVDELYGSHKLGFIRSVVAYMNLGSDLVNCE